MTHKLTKMLLTDRTTNALMDVDVRHTIPRHQKRVETQKKRTKASAEVFTPSWVCNAQNNLIDEAWFGRKDVFNTEGDKSWTANLDKIVFSADKSWKDYVKANMLEITCGESPYLASRYDTVSGMTIEVPNRIGLLDRKLRVVTENTASESEWLEHAIMSVQATYGYEYQQDSLWLARKNVVQSVKEHFFDVFGRRMPSDYVERVAYIVSWNIFRMDGLRMVIPGSCSPTCKGCKCKGLDGIHRHDGIYVRVMDWDAKETLEFRELVKNDK